MISAQDALDRLRAGNERFVAGNSAVDASRSQTRRKELTKGQEPFAIVLGCADSRVPVEKVFDQGLGDLFVVRVAGNVVAPSQIGSIEFAAEHFGTQLVVVLGHTNCGAVAATIAETLKPSANCSPGLLSIVERIQPTVAPLLSEKSVQQEADLLNKAVRANVVASVSQLSDSSEVLQQLIGRSALLVVGAEYSLDTGVVDFF
ncbi:MAG: carbonic anhydrase [Gammaproteobacteria bacterium]